MAKMHEKNRNPDAVDTLVQDVRTLLVPLEPLRDPVTALERFPLKSEEKAPENVPDPDETYQKALGLRALSYLNGHMEVAARKAAATGRQVAEGDVGHWECWALLHQVALAPTIVRSIGNLPGDDEENEYRFLSHLYWSPTFALGAWEHVADKEVARV